MQHRTTRGVIAQSLALFFSLPLGFFCSSAECSDKQAASRDGIELLRQAEQVTDILAGGAPPFRLTAQVEVFDGYC